MQVRTLHLQIAGRVQGVGYRDAMRREAERLGLTGWVRNRVDGEVEAVIRGDQAGLDTLVSWARRGPPGACVVHVECSAPPSEYDRDYARFERWPTA